LREIPISLRDDFAPDAEAVREAVIAGDFASHTGPDGAIYTGISGYSVPQWYDLISKVVGRPITPRLSCFRLNLKGELPHSWVHSDDICAEFASVLYLNSPEQCSGGTAFWKHTGLNVDRLPSEEQILARGMLPTWFHRMMTQEWKDLTFWEQTQFVEMKWNRFITYPTCFFHSRYPFEAFGKGPQDGRLIWICFYDA
jgi:hypothetical protein